MDLKEFVKESILQLSEGVREAQKEINEKKLGEGISDNYYKVIKYDIAVSTTETDKKGLGGKITVANLISVGGEGEKSNLASNYSRIQFELSVHIKTQPSASQKIKGENVL
ncbi:MAG TPA: hypothetical protein PKY46_14455 [Ignavibacteriaceae bacterium]|nr:hypothetical protein [Ignavibacteriaceae bacterium]